MALRSKIADDLTIALGALFHLLAKFCATMFDRTTNTTTDAIDRLRGYAVAASQIGHRPTLTAQMAALCLIDPAGHQDSIPSQTMPDGVE